MFDAHKPPVGARPGTLAIHDDAASPIVTLLAYDETSIERRTLDSLDETDALRAKRTIWIDIQGLGDEPLLRELAERFSIHPLALEDIVHAPIRPKSEPYEDNLLVVTRMLRHGDAENIDVEQVSLLIGPDYVLTFQEQYGDMLDPVRQRLEGTRSRIRTLGPDYLGYAILDTIIDAYYPVVERLGERLELLEERVLVDASPETLRELNTIKRQLMNLRRAVAPQREAINSMIRDDYLRDTHDHIIQTSEAIESARELVNGLMNTYLSVVSNRMNEVMKTLTIVASIFVPLTFMAGIYGMNFSHMPELQIDWAYPALLVAMGIVACGMLIYFWRKGWIGPRA